MTRAIFEAETKDDLKYFVALARKQGLVVKYLKVSIKDNVVKKVKKQNRYNMRENTNSVFFNNSDLVTAQISSMDKIWNSKEEDETWSIL